MRIPKHGEIAKQWNYLSFLFATGVLLLSCQNEKKDLIDNFEEINALVIKGQFENLIQQLDTPSSHLLESLTDTDNLNIDSIIKIGADHQIGLFSVLYFNEFGNYIKSTGRKSDFFKYLAKQSTPWFSVSNKFSLVPDKIRIGSEIFIPISKKRQNGSKVLYWLNFTDNRKEGIQFNLLDFLKQQERRIWKLYAESLGPRASGAALEQQLKSLWRNLGDMKIHASLWDDEEFDRSSLYFEE